MYFDWSKMYFSSGKKSGKSKAIDDWLKEKRKSARDEVKSWPAGFADLKLKDGVYQE